MAEAHFPSATTPSSDWSTFNLNNTRFNAGEITLNSTNVTRLKQAWVTPSTVQGAGFNTELTSSNGFIYAYMPNSLLTAINMATGKIVWQQSLPGGTSAVNAPTIANGIVYATDGTALYAFDAVTGKARWTANIYASLSPVVEQGIVYVQSGLGFPDGFGSVYAVNVSTGAVLWSCVTDYALGFTSPSVVNGIVYVGDSNGRVYAIKGENASGPLISDGDAACK